MRFEGTATSPWIFAEVPLVLSRVHVRTRNSALRTIGGEFTDRLHTGCSPPRSPASTALSNVHFFFFFFFFNCDGPTTLSPFPFILLPLCLSLRETGTGSLIKEGDFNTSLQWEIFKQDSWNSRSKYYSCFKVITILYKRLLSMINAEYRERKFSDFSRFHRQNTDFWYRSMLTLKDELMCSIIRQFKRVCFPLVVFKIFSKLRNVLNRRRNQAAKALPRERSKNFAHAFRFIRRI